MLKLIIASSIYSKDIVKYTSAAAWHQSHAQPDVILGRYLSLCLLKLLQQHFCHACCAWASKGVWVATGLDNPGDKLMLRLQRVPAVVLSRGRYGSIKLGSCSRNALCKPVCLFLDLAGPLDIWAAQAIFVPELVPWAGPFPQLNEREAHRPNIHLL